MLVHYLTSFSRKLYLATGKDLVKSYGKFQVKIGESSLLLQYSEDTAAPCRPINPEYLNWYLNTFKHLIPPILGGTASVCNCSGYAKSIATNKTVHKPGCHNTLWNRNAYRWFHKVAAIKTWLDSLNSSNTPDYMVWLDCDCYFKQHLPNQVIADLCDKYDICYLKGTKREAIESGILIFNMQTGWNSGYWLINDWFHYYKSQQFLRYDRWDDGYILTKVVRDCSGYKQHDLVKGKAISRPADGCPLTPYIGHNKGTHVRDHRLF